MAKAYILSDITRKIGSRHNTWIYELTWVDPDDLRIYAMIVDESFRNYSKWQHIIDVEALGIYTGLKRKDGQDKDGLNIMNADSTPQLIEFLTPEDIVTYIELRQQQLT